MAEHPGSPEEIAEGQARLKRRPALLTRPTDAQPSLAAALARIRATMAEESDARADLAAAARMRLELLADDLRPLVGELGERGEPFTFALSGGANPRFWIDATSFVRMSADGRGYELARDGRAGRTILHTGQDRSEVARAVADHVARLVLERERAMDGDWQPLVPPATASAHPAPQPASSPPQKAGFGLYLFNFLLGALIGVLALLAWVWLRQAPPAP